MMGKLMVMVGTRPEIIKMAPVIRALKIRGISFTLVHCGQHYDYEMSQQFIKDLELPEPDFGFKLKATTQGTQTAHIITQMEQLAIKTNPTTVLVEGDTNGVLATALATVKLGIPVGHVEAGLRSHDLRMPEEHNRRLTDHISSYLFAPTKAAEDNLRLENVWGKTFVTGNTVIDAVMQHLPIAEKNSTIIDKVPFKHFALATAHRAENVDNVSTLEDLMKAFAEAPIPVVYPMHPRTRKRLRQHKLYAKLTASRNLQILPPLGYLDFLILMKKCDMIVTDSGGIQEEATAPNIRKPVLVIRISTERQEAVEAGFAKVVGTQKKGILIAMEECLNRKIKLPTHSLYGDGNSAERIVEILDRELSL